MYIRRELRGGVEWINRLLAGGLDTERPGARGRFYVGTQFIEHSTVVSLEEVVLVFIHAQSR